MGTTRIFKFTVDVDNCCCLVLWCYVLFMYFPYPCDKHDAPNFPMLEVGHGLSPKQDSNRPDFGVSQTITEPDAYRRNGATQPNLPSDRNSDRYYGFFC